MLVNGDRYSSAETHLSLQANHTLPFVAPDLHKILQHRAPPVSESLTGGNSPKLSANRSPPTAGYKRPNTPPHYELVRIPSPAPAPNTTASQLADTSSAALSNIPRNSRGETVRSCLKPEDNHVRRPYYTTVPRGKKSLTFNNLLEHVCLFIRGSRVSEIPEFEQYGVRDTGDVDSPTLSASLAQLESWVIASKNTPTLPSFDQWVPVRLDAVTIENSRVLAGSILVRNLDFHKTVTVRYSVDNWSTTAEVPATFANVITPSGHGFAGIDRFLFRIDLGKEFSASALKGNFSFALRYEVGGQTYWDNNQGSNYNLELTRAATASSSKSPTSPVTPTTGTPTNSRQPLFPWADPAALPTSSRTTRPIRPSPSAPVFIPTFARASSPRAESPLSTSFIPVAVSRPTLCVEVSVPPGLQVSPSSSPSSSIPIPDQSSHGHAKSSPRPIPRPSLPRTASYPPASPRSCSPCHSSPIAIAAANHRGRSPSPSLYLDSIEIPFSSASVGSMADYHISRNFHSTGLRRGGGSLYADSDNFGLGYGCSPPSPHSGYAACRA